MRCFGNITTKDALLTRNVANFASESQCDFNGKLLLVALAGKEIHERNLFIDVWIGLLEAP